MSSITQTNDKNLKSGAAITSENLIASEFRGTDGSLSMSEIMAKLAELQSKLRDLIQEYNSLQQTRAFDNQLAALGEKRSSIRSELKGNRTSAIAGISSGVVGVGFSGASAVTKTEFLTHIGGGLGKSGEGIAGVVCAEHKLDAGLDQTSGEFMSKNSDSYERTTADSTQKAQEISRKMLDMLREMTQMSGQIASAIRL